MWGRKTHEVLMLTYLILTLWLIGPLLALLVAFVLQLPEGSLSNSALIAWEWVECSNPYYLAFAPYSDPGKVGLMTYLGFLGSCLFLSAWLLGVAMRRIRCVALKQAGQQAPNARQGLTADRPRRSKWAPATRSITRRQPSSLARVASS